MVLIGLGVGYFLRKNIAEGKLNQAEQEAARIIANGERTAESKKKEALLEAKEEIHKLRSDVERENKDRRSELQRLERRIAELAAQEELDSIRPDLDGGQIMQILGIAPGPVVGEAYKFLLNVRLDEGSLPEEEAKARLLQWWEQRREA